MTRVRRVETVMLVLVAIVLAAATINDVVRQTHTNQRLIADLRTWRTYTGHDYHNLSVEQTVLGERSRHEVVCGNTAPGAPKANTQLCLAIWGPLRGGRRTVHGHWYLPPRVEDIRADRYGCSGREVLALCPARAVPAASGATQASPDSRASAPSAPAAPAASGAGGTAGKQGQ